MTNTANLTTSDENLLNQHMEHHARVTIRDLNALNSIQFLAVWIYVQTVIGGGFLAETIRNQLVAIIRLTTISAKNFVDMTTNDLIAFASTKRWGKVPTTNQVRDLGLLHLRRFLVHCHHQAGRSYDDAVAYVNSIMPAAQALPHLAEATTRKRVFVSTDEAERMIRAAPQVGDLQEGLQAAAIVCLLREFATRGVSVRRLLVEDVQANSDGTYVITPRPGTRTKRVPPSFTIVRSVGAIHEWLGVHPSPTNQKAPLFPYLYQFRKHNLVVPHHGESLGTLIQRVAEAANIGRYIGPLAFRHRFLTEQTLAGVDDNVARRLMGHVGKADMLQRYAHHDDSNTLAKMLEVRSLKAETRSRLCHACWNLSEPNARACSCNGLDFGTPDWAKFALPNPTLPHLALEAAGFTG